MSEHMLFCGIYMVMGVGLALFPAVDDGSRGRRDCR